MEAIGVRGWRGLLVAVVAVGALLPASGNARAEAGAPAKASKTIVLDQISIESGSAPARAFYIIRHHESEPPRLVLVGGSDAEQLALASDYSKFASAWETLEARRRELKELVERGRAERDRLERGGGAGAERSWPLLAERAGFVAPLGSSKGLAPVRRELARAWPELARCGEGAEVSRARGAALFVVDGHGAVVDARWLAPGGTTALGDCLVRRLRALRVREQPETAQGEYLLDYPPDPAALEETLAELGGGRALGAPARRGRAAPPLLPTGGELDASVVTQVMRREVSGLRACYESALEHDPNLEGRIVVRFVIGEEGRVTSVEVVENSLSAEVGRCLAARIATFRFPPPEGGSVTFTYPFVFRPG